jgi:hypothetical protein
MRLAVIYLSLIVLIAAPNFAGADDGDVSGSGYCDTCVDQINSADKADRLKPIPVEVAPSPTPNPSPTPVAMDPFPPAKAQFSRSVKEAYKNASPAWNKLSGVEQAKFIYEQFKTLVPAHGYKLKASLLTCIAWIETANNVGGSMKMNPWSKSSTGAIGAGQALRSTAADLFNRYGFRSVVKFPAGRGGAKYSDIRNGKTFAEKSVHSLVAQLDLIVGVAEMKRRDGGSGDREIARNYYAGPGAGSYAAKAISCTKDIDTNGISMRALRKAR